MFQGFNFPNVLGGFSMRVIVTPLQDKSYWSPAPGDLGLTVRIRKRTGTHELMGCNPPEAGSSVLSLSQ